VGLQPLRPAAVQPLLQVLHREGLGRPTTEIRAEWAAQRIKGLSFWSAARDAFFGDGDQKVKSLIKEFNYPRYGPGQMWEEMTDRIRSLGGEVLLESPVEAFTWRTAASPRSW
jgi:hypothetical protein